MLIETDARASETWTRTGLADLPPVESDSLLQLIEVHLFRLNSLTHDFREVFFESQRHGCI